MEAGGAPKGGRSPLKLAGHPRGERAVERWSSHLRHQPGDQHEVRQVVAEEGALMFPARVTVREQAVAPVEEA